MPHLNLPPPFAQIPRHPLLYPHHSPIHPLPALTKHLLPTHNKITLHAKREDQASPLASAGNKYRKLEYLVPDILSPTPQYGGLGPSPERGSAPPPPPPSSTTRTKKTTTLVTEGALQSNHTVQVAALANHLRLDAVLLLHKTTGGGWRAAPDPRAFARSGNVQIAGLLGAEIRLLESANNEDEDASTADDDDPIAAIIHTLRTQHGKIPYWIPSGASLHPLGGLGYARCAFEIAAQEEEQEEESQNAPNPQTSSQKSQFRYDYIFVACGSGSTLGGLIAGFKLLEKMEIAKHPQTTATAAAGQQRPRPRPPRKIIGVLTSPTSPKAYHEARVLRFARQAAGRIGLDPQRDVTADDVTLEDRFVGAGYGVLDPETKHTINMMARTEAVVLDPVYTAKVARAMMHWVGTGELEEDWRRRMTDTGKTAEEPDSVNVLFIHTGGQSALSAYADVE
ncbi:tryptophan synthase beta subunit-like PLP-dependent enzyme [Aspergillus uvarum CBS 121591]|uniref:Tryptophan synthase beta subunit-like PLP-dependent enzyme n=1 Tax=Aspergillus uvarum CBS 121591 TaxID=1448315 RepID=A0A319C2P5_9EURO|nr:tryptophan synthase beta subunit-like PLP-dependent enzyme [Aspergillus uvarum CBS 121591]PYH78521.1 tryptophan synthase beta subunit-like PLP-dependent enzyme [Aspergillus uvarum CBS 121591]